MRLTRTGRLWVYVREDRNAGQSCRRWCGSLTRRIARDSTHNDIWQNTVVCFRRMRMRVTTRSMKTASSQRSAVARQKSGWWSGKPEQSL